MRWTCTYFIALSVSLCKPVNGLIFFNNFMAFLFLLSEQLEIVEKLFHYENTPIQYTIIFFFRCKIDNFQLKNLDIFHIFAQNIDCGSYM